jgi:hypothetical protein
MQNLYISDWEQVSIASHALFRGSFRGYQLRAKGIVELDATIRTSRESLIDVIVALNRTVLLEYRCSRNPSHTVPFES